jgi:succinate-acetate transporter protein
MREKRENGSEEKRENGSAMMAIGWVLVLFALLVLFFHPAGLKLGETRFAVIAACLVVVGVILAIAGTWMRRKSN